MMPDLILRDLPMPIRTPRLLITPPAAGMGAAFHEAKIETLESNKEWLGWAHHASNPHIEEAMMRKQAAKFMAREDLMLIVFNHNGRLIGSTGFHFLNQFATPILHMGYWCRQSEQGKGYVTEWVNALTQYSFDILNLKKLSIEANSENLASIAVAKRLGFDFEYGVKWGITKPGTDEMQVRNVYSRFDTVGLPSLDVSWGDKPSP